MQNTLSYTINTVLGGIENSKSTARFPSVNQTREQNPNRVFPTAQALIQAITVKADMALYITAHEEKGIRLDNLCQEVCYEQGVFFLMTNIRGTWYITEVITTNGDEGYMPVFFWTRIKRGCDVLAARVLLCWRRLTAKQSLTTD